MKFFRAHKPFTPIATLDSGIIIVPKTNYEVIDINQDFGVHITIKLEKNNFTVYITPEEIKNYGEVESKLTSKELKKILNDISFLKSCVDFNWDWEIAEIYDKNNIGFLINTTFKRPDVATGILGSGNGRRMWIESTASETSVIMTAWICVELIVKHELMESFLYKGAKILNPHKTLDELAFPEKLLT